MKILSLIGILLAFGGCATLDAEMIRELAKDQASFCARAGASGGAGGGGLVAGAVSGGYGQADFAFCRSNHPGATVTLGADGSIGIKHQ